MGGSNRGAFCLSGANLYCPTSFSAGRRPATLGEIVLHGSDRAPAGSFEALEEAYKYQQAVEHREASFLSHFRAWVESTDRR